MSQYLLYSGGKARFMEIDIKKATSDELRTLQSDFEKAHGGYARLVKLDYQESAAGIIYEWGLCGADGAWFYLYPMPWQDSVEVASAKDFLRRTRDVVQISVLRITKFV